MGCSSGFAGRTDLLLLYRAGGARSVLELQWGFFRSTKFTRSPSVLTESEKSRGRVYPCPPTLFVPTAIMPPYTPAPYASKFGNLWVRLKYVGEGEPPTRDFVAEELLFQSSWVNPRDIYSFISLPNRRDFELCFLQEAPLRRFMEIVASNSGQPKWKEWTVESSLQIETTTLVVKFWTGRIPDHDIELYLKRYCDVLHPPIKPVDKFGLWYGIRKFKVRLRRDEDGHFIHIPNSISLGPYNGRVIYPGQAARCFICQASDHQVKECPTIKCWKCGNLGHKAKECQNESECSLCGQIGHTFFKCPKSYANMAKNHDNDISALTQMWGPGHSIISIGEDSADGVGIFF
uniref:CCHC-type domain-containing protein n=1 Tax=Oreochromis aureus TaxID=47969 RepID=A0AAZ1XGG0_OREAU